MKKSTKYQLLAGGMTIVILTLITKKSRLRKLKKERPKMDTYEEDTPTFI